MFADDLKKIDMDNLNILIIDDEISSRKFIKVIVEKLLKAKATEAGNPKIALECLKNTLPSLIILDLRMPLMDGYSFLKNLRQIERIKNVPVIAYSVISNYEAVIKLAKLGISDYIVKPSSKEIILKKIKKVLAEGKLLKLDDIKKDIDNNDEITQDNGKYLADKSDKNNDGIIYDSSQD